MDESSFEDSGKDGASDGKFSFKMEDLKVGYRMEAKDFDGKWYPVKVAEIDWDELEVLVHFENWNAKFDEWLPFNSDRLRSVPSPTDDKKGAPKFKKGESVMASWSSYQRFPGTVQAVLSNDFYDILFYDGYVKRLRGSKVHKVKASNLKDFDVKQIEDIGTKEERRERKRKINVAELFHVYKKRSSSAHKKGVVGSGSSDHKTYPANKPVRKSLPEIPVRKESPAVTSPVASTAGVVSSTKITKIVEPATLEVKYLDGRTETWHKQWYRRSEGRSAGKMDIVITNVQGRKFRCRNEIMKYCEENKIIYSPEAFDFSVKGRPKSKSILQTDMTSSSVDPVVKKQRSKSMIETAVSGATPSSLAVPVVQLTKTVVEEEHDKKIYIGDVEVVREDGQLKCPSDNCNKHFRRENLLHMHMKHYHPEFSKYLDYTPSVTDLAYARTAGTLETDIGLQQQTQQQQVSTPAQKKVERDKTTVVKHDEKPVRTNSNASATNTDLVKDLKKIMHKVAEQNVHEGKASSSLLLNKLSKQTSAQQHQHDNTSCNLLQQHPSTSTPQHQLIDETNNTSPNENKENFGRLTQHVKDEVEEQMTENLMKKRKRYQDSLLEHLKRRKVDVDEFGRKDKSKHHRANIRHSSSVPRSKQLTLSGALSGDDRSNLSSSPHAHTSDGATEGTEDSKSPLPRDMEKLEKLKRNEIINCSCGITEEDGLMIQCDLCLCWQHGHCLNIFEATQVPEKYICHTCRHPFRGRSSMKYYNDQAWMKDGILPSLSFRSKRHDLIKERSAKLKRSFDLSGSISHLKQLLHTLNVKLNIAQRKDHPKLWLWAEKWFENNPKKAFFDVDRRDTNQNSSDTSTTVEKSENQAPKAPEPEAPIDPAECRINLLDHILHFESIVDARLASIESQVAELESMEEDAIDNESPEKYPRTKATIHMLLRDVNRMKDVAEALK